MEVQLWGKTVVLFPAQAKLLRVEEVMELTVLHPVLRPLEQLAVLLQGAAGEVVAQELPLVNQETEADQVDMWPLSSPPSWAARWCWSTAKIKRSALAPSTPAQ